MSASQEIKQLLPLLKIEKQADLEYFQNKILRSPLERRKKEGLCWYPVDIKKKGIGLGEKWELEIERSSHLEENHVFSSGKIITLFHNTGKKEREFQASGVVNYVRKDRMMITLNSDDLPDWIDAGNLGVDLLFDELSYREMEYAVKAVSKAESGRITELREKILGYEKANFSEQREPAYWFSILNESQQAAVKQILSAKDVAVVHGPPGTGKTTTLVEAILQVLQSESQVMVCAPSNAAIDLLVEKLSDKKVEVVRLGHPARVTDQALEYTLDVKMAAHTSYRDLKLVRKKAEEFKSLAGKYKRNFGHAEREQRRMLQQESKRYLEEADLLEHYILGDVLEKAKVVCCTLVGASSYLLKGKTFGTVFIDEAAQALEPASWIPILKAQRVIFAGDHFQLPPTIKSIEAARGGLSTTLMEKCQGRQEVSRMLQVQYRMHEDIMGFSSEQFYQDKLEAAESVKHHLLHEQEAPLVFIDTAGSGFGEHQDEETLSMANLEEAHFMINQLEQLVNRLIGLGMDPSGINYGLISPYRAQVSLLESLLPESIVLKDISQLITIQTIDGFQGQERDVIMISLVRSNSRSEIGFLSDTRRMNVALTRAKKKLVVIGDSATIGNDSFYSRFINYCQEKNAYHSVFEFLYES